MSSKRVLAIQKKLKEKKEQEEINERLRDEAEIQLKMEKIKERRKKPQQKKRKIVERKKSRLEMTLKEVKQEKRDVKERKELVRKKSLDTEERLKKEKQADKERKELVIPQPKEPKKKKRFNRKRDKEMQEIKREVEKSGKESKKLQADAQEINRRINAREIKILGGNGISFANKNSIESNTLAGHIQTQKQDVCKGKFLLSLAQVRRNDSIYKISRDTVVAILTYTVSPASVNINNLCSRLSGNGKQLLRKLESKFPPNRTFTLDAIPTAVGFWEKMGFTVVGQVGTGSTLTAMIKN